MRHAAAGADAAAMRYCRFHARRCYRRQKRTRCAISAMSPVCARFSHDADVSCRLPPAAAAAMLAIFAMTPR